MDRKIIIGIASFVILIIAVSCSKDKPNEPAPEPLDTTPKFVYDCEIDDNFEIFTMNPDGTEQINLTNHDSMDVTPDWSPDGQKIAFSSNRSGSFQIYLMDYDGNNVTQLTTAGHNRLPVWSPDGEKIAYVMQGILNERNIFTINADGTNIDQITSNNNFKSSPNWSPDSRQLTFNYIFSRPQDETVGGTAVVNADGTGYKSVYELTRPGTILFSYETPEFSPDGSVILFSTIDNHIFTVEPNGDNLNRLTTEGSNYDPHFSPDGLAVTFYSNQSSGQYDIWLMAPNGSGQYNLTNSISDDIKPVWSHDGTMVTYLSDYQTDAYYDLFAVAVDPFSTYGFRITDNNISEYTVKWRPVDLY